VFSLVPFQFHPGESANDGLFESKLTCRIGLFYLFEIIYGLLLFYSVMQSFLLTHCFASLFVFILLFSFLGFFLPSSLVFYRFLLSMYLVFVSLVLFPPLPPPFFSICFPFVLLET